MFESIHLDFLANVPQNKVANALFHTEFANPNTFDNAFLSTFKADSLSLAKFFDASFALGFDYSCGEFLSLFDTLHKHHFRIALAPSLSQQSFYAGERFTAIYPSAISFLPLNPNGIIKNCKICLESTQNHAHNHSTRTEADSKKIQENSVRTDCIDSTQSIAFFIPLINQDLLTLNPIKSLIEEIFTTYENVLIFCDISLFLSSLTQEKCAFLRSLMNLRVFFICNGESIGLIRKSGFILSPTQTLSPALKDYNTTQLLRPHLFKAALIALESILATPKAEDSKVQFFESLKAKLQDNIGLFAPLHLSAPNTLALRLKHIKAREIIQALQIEGIYAINGLDCLYGNAKPSFVLQSMGYEEAQCRELISISYVDLKDIESIATSIANAYLQLRQFC